MKSDLQTMIQAAKSGGRVLKKYFGKNLETHEKTMAADVRTKADIESEEAVLGVLQKAFPRYNIYSEERGIIDNDSEYMFAIDPLDGTNNFLLGIPYFSVSIALIQDTKTQAAVVHNPILNHTYYAMRGEGAFFNDNRIAVNREDDLTKASVVYATYYTSSLEYFYKLIKKLYTYRVKRVLNFWSPALDFCLLASGKIEVIINNESEIYDFLAGKLIAKEAGAKITDFQGKEEIDDKNSIFVAANGTKLHAELLKMLPPL